MTINACRDRNMDIILFGSGAICGKMLFVRIIENNKIDAYFRSGFVK